VQGGDTYGGMSPSSRFDFAVQIERGLGLLLQKNGCRVTLIPLEGQRHPNRNRLRQNGLR
jgi:hypothetical protein